MKKKYLAALAAAAIEGFALYAWMEARRYSVQTYRIPVLPEGAEPLRILQVSDLHLRPGNHRLISFLEGLADERCDLVLATGDLLGGPESVGECVRVLNGLNGKLGRYVVFGSSDYYAPVLKNYFDYFTGRKKLSTRRNPTGTFRAGLTEAGWEILSNRNIQADLNGIRAQITGLDDPFLNRDDRDLLVREPFADFALCVVHDPSPYTEAFKAGYDLVVSGHTHGGQVRLPFIGAVVTNSDLPTRYARGASDFGGRWLFVSPGLGTGKFAPFRFLCPPEASVLELVARDEPDDEGLLI